MDFLKAILMGVVEGLTEFIPISSTAHLIIFGDLLSFTKGNAATFDVSIQLGAILAVVFLYPTYFKSWLNPKNWLSKEFKLVVLGSIPALVIAFFIYSFIKSLFSPAHVIGTLALGGVIMIIVERYYTRKPKTFSVEDMSYKQALGIGFFQCASLWPGMSRSGSSIVGGLLMKLDHATSAKFSFLMSVPIMLCAVGYELLKSYKLLTLTDIHLILVGMVVSFIVGYFAMVTFLKLLQRWKLVPFAIYRIVLAAFVYYYFLT